MDGLHGRELELLEDMAQMLLELYHTELSCAPEDKQPWYSADEDTPELVYSITSTAADRVLKELKTVPNLKKFAPYLIVLLVTQLSDTRRDAVRSLN